MNLDRLEGILFNLFISTPTMVASTHPVSKPGGGFWVPLYSASQKARPLALVALASGSTVLVHVGGSLGNEEIATVKQLRLVPLIHLDTGCR